ncbi:pectinacetylesterase-like protein [Skeletonema marinoi]|uniref:Pectinacetylesterase-like protein n=1 Tax=Skeletonema marinoi TaxID=267567 RepID=A0AAD8YB61_9STRA|nr:pectinacetylesterase-like protein [Skeletonema marinoi]
MNMKQRIATFLLLSAAMANGDDSTIISYKNCDANSLPAENTSISTLNNGQFYKMCPGSHKHSNNDTFATLGQPKCGDGSNFAFYLTRPEQPQQGEQPQKVLIELSGGGACWDKGTCALQSFFLKMPPLDFVLGMSCSDVGKIAEVSEGWDILCARTVGETDFTEYNTIVIPYCTQDVHLGDAAEALYDGTTIQHVGGHNTYRTLQWVFDNFEDPSHIVLTGCSAGATPLPVFYHMIKEHYKARGRNVKVNIISDSPVYLTPRNFLENHFQFWNHETVMKSIGFDYDTHKEDVQYASAVLDYVLDGSDDSDGIGVVSHNDDAISLMYYIAMGGDDDTKTSVETQWWAEMNNSWSQTMNEHTNFDVFIINGSGHCSSGLYFANQQPDFEKWVSNIVASASLIYVQQETVVMNTSVTMTAATDPTSTTTEAYESRPVESPVSPMNNTFPSSGSETDTPSAATCKATAGHILIATFLCLQLCLLLG